MTETDRDRDPEQVIFGRALLDALRDVGVIPRSVYTVPPATVTIEAKEFVTLSVRIVLPLDKWRAALDLVHERALARRGEA